ncbi:MAG: DUF4115 domain-containing protein [Rhodospirillaceae bacterium]|nr:DUF4115 domain-containing protein [Rhodospirillaceae bacterium]
MTDHNTVDEWPDEDAPLGGRAGMRRRAARGLHLQQIEEPDEESTYSGIGTEMRVERQRRQLTIEEVSGILRIQKAHLSALEEGRTDDLPGPTYAIGFLRTYSEFLGLDGDEVIRQYKSEETLTPGERRLVFPEPVEEARRPGLSLALVSLIVAGAVYGGWIFLEQRGLMPIEIVAEPPQRLIPYQAAAVTPVTADATLESEPEAIVPGTQTLAVGEDTSEVGKVGATASTETTPETTPETPTAALAVTASVRAAADNTDNTDAVTGITAQAGSIEQPAMGQKPEPDEGERAAAADVGGLTNATDTPMVVASVATPEVTATDVSAAEPSIQSPETTSPVALKSVVELSPAPTSSDTTNPDPTNPTSTLGDAASADPTGHRIEVLTVRVVVDPTSTEPTSTEPTSSETASTETASSETIVSEPASSPPPRKREGSDVDTAPAMPAIQAAIAPPPPPAAPAAPARPLAEGSGEVASNGDEGRASLATAAEGLGYRPQVYGASNRGVRVVLRARAESWVQIQGANNELLLTRMLRAGDSYHAPNRTDLVLMTGNAGAIEIMVDGEALGTLGPVGKVRRNIKLNAEHLRDQLHAAADSQ